MHGDDRPVAERPRRRLAAPSGFDDPGEVRRLDGDTARPPPPSITDDGTTITYMSAGNFDKTDSFFYDGSDGSDGSVDVRAMVSVVIVPEDDDAPSAADDDVVVDEDETIVIDVLTNDDTGVDLSETLIMPLVQSTSGMANVTDQGGNVFISGGGTTVTYTPPGDFFSADAEDTDSFNYVIDDGTPNGEGGELAEATVTVTVNAVNDAPVVQNISGGLTFEDEPIDLDLAAAASDVDGMLVPESIEIVSQPTNGTVEKSEDAGVYRYTPNAEFSALLPDSFTFRTTDSNGAFSNTGTASVVVAKVNDGVPVFVVSPGSTAIDEDTSSLPLTIRLSDPDVGDGGPTAADTITLSAVSSNADIVPNLDLNLMFGSSEGVGGLETTLTIMPAPDKNGIVTITLTAGDGSGEPDRTAQFTLAVRSTNDPPVAVDDVGATVEGTPVTIDVLMNDDLDTPDSGETLSVESFFFDPLNGSVARDVDPNTNMLIYTPTEFFVGIDSFFYTVGDGNGGTDSGMVTITVTAASPPDGISEAVDDDFTINEDAGAMPLNVLLNDVLEPGEMLTITSAVALMPVDAGMVMVSPGAATVTFTPTGDFNGLVTFDYTISDGGDSLGEAGTGTVSVTVLPVNDAPSPMPDSGAGFEVVEESGANLLDVLANDSDLEDDALTVALTVVAVTQGGQGGVVAIAEKGSMVTYAPRANFVGFESFTYTVSDSNGDTAIGNVTVNVTDVNDPPTRGGRHDVPRRRLRLGRDSAGRARERHDRTGHRGNADDRFRGAGGGTGHDRGQQHE